ncbi:winged helix DNA-binding protein [Sphingomonas sediminicola]|jgi:DNA-binding MarR family transcriptional regulator|uniref:Winged helix DNA-binding protein n=1 Tax=Sphingomonas sediminicola TaxID=386874 RepID=A0ABX6T8L7_9SPHN|nr:MarR family transcriptional regulator [Sphingomonas sediminicola]QNP46120.1 winged helix DNA-binding protein [Sphingomonas sediminicola]
MLWGSSPAAVAARYVAVSQLFLADGPAERADRARRILLSAVASNEPATLNQVAKTVGRGAPAVSRSVDALVRVGLVERAADPDNRRRLAMRLTQAGRDVLQQPSESGALASKLERLAPSEVRAIERAVEILERAK